MTTPVREMEAAVPMTPERWRAVDTILQGALACEPARRDGFVADACAGDDALLREVISLLRAHDGAADDFLERPASEALGVRGAPIPLADRLAKGLAGRYAIERVLAHGGMATVFLGRDLRHGRRVAIKVLSEELAAAVGGERFLEEIRVTASLQHPHILPLFDSGNADGLLWYAMPYIEGETLRSRLAREGRLPMDVALRIAREVADALEYAHRHGVVHRDVKPENVLLQDGHALVADFGIALALEQAAGARLTRTGITLGTPQYMAPEQAAGDRPIDARTDVYALGVVLHEMLAGESPFGDASQHGMLRRVMHVSPMALATRRADVSWQLDAAVRRALAKLPGERFASAAAFSAALAAPDAEAEAPYVAPVVEPPSDSSRAQHTTASGSRKVPARAALYVAGIMLAIGLAGGWALARSPVVERVSSTVPDVVRSPIGADVRPTIAPPIVSGDLSLSVFDRGGKSLHTIAATHPWTPRISPDGRRVAYGAWGDGRGTHDLWVTNIDGSRTERLTDDDADSNDPQWSSNGAAIAYSAAAPGGKDVMMRKLGGAEGVVLAARSGTQFPSDWARDGSLLVTEQAGDNRNDILVQPKDGSAPQPYAATAADETAARISPDGKWVAYTSDESGQPEVYLDSYPRPHRRVKLSSNGGVHPVWRGDGRELYYWNGDALTAVRLEPSRGGEPPAVDSRSVLFRAPYEVGLNTMYDVSPDGQTFVVVVHRQ